MSFSNATLSQPRISVVHRQGHAGCLIWRSLRSTAITYIADIYPNLITKYHVDQCLKHQPRRLLQEANWNDVT